jgi:hypothetical protein
MKILYAAGNNKNALLQLARFMQAMNGKPYIIKVAAYQQSSPNINIDWTLNCLQNIFKPDNISLDNDNYVTYFNQVKYYSPDLIISDMEYFTSHIANILGITLWQCSSSLINYSLTNEYKYNLGVFKRYAFLFNRNPTNTQRTLNILDNSNCKFVYSHFGDCNEPPELKEEYEWIRPYHVSGKLSIPCQHNIVAGTIGDNKKIVDLMADYSDSICFNDVAAEFYDNPKMKDIKNQEEYACNLRNSKLFMCSGQTSFLADAFYNQKYSIVLPNLEDPECVVNSTISEKLKLSTSVYQSSDDLNPFIGLEVYSAHNKDTKFLHQKVEELCDLSV